eukprot:COSAG04_NODE_323_length_16882_cov_5.975627_21_plen_781_part_00
MERSTSQRPQYYDQLLPALPGPGAEWPPPLSRPVSADAVNSGRPANMLLPSQASAAARRQEAQFAQLYEGRPANMLPSQASTAARRQEAQFTQLFQQDSGKLDLVEADIAALRAELLRSESAGLRRSGSSVTAGGESYTALMVTRKGCATTPALRAAQQRFAWALGMRFGPTGPLTDVDVIFSVGQMIVSGLLHWRRLDWRRWGPQMAVAEQAAVWAPHLSHPELAFGDPDANVANAERCASLETQLEGTKQTKWLLQEMDEEVPAFFDADIAEMTARLTAMRRGYDDSTIVARPWGYNEGDSSPTACVSVPRGDAEWGVALAIEVIAMPKEYGSSFAFGVGRTIPEDGGWGFSEQTCGLRQSVWDTAGRSAATNGFGKRVGFAKFEPPITEGSRLALHLSARSSEGTRTARFFVNGSEVVVFADVEDDGGDTDWVAGVTLSPKAQVRIAPAEGAELLTEPERRAEAVFSAEVKIVALAVKKIKALNPSLPLDKIAPKAREMYPELDESGVRVGPKLVLAALQLLQQRGELPRSCRELPALPKDFEAVAKAIASRAKVKVAAEKQAVAKKAASKVVKKRVAAEQLAKRQAASKVASRPMEWDRQLSHPKVPCVAVPHAGDLAMAVVVDSLPKLELSSVFSFGLGHAKGWLVRGWAKGFGLDEGTCGLVQETRVYQGSNRGALANGLGRRVDRAGTKLAPPIKQGSRLALNLSAADARGRRLARFFVDASEAATFALQDDGSNTGWVAGVTLSDRARVRLVPAEGAELAQRARAINEVMIF